MARFVLIIFALFAVSISRANADTLVLVQGYLGDAGSWRATGIVRVLGDYGWRDAGHMSARAGQIIKFPSGQSGKNRVYTIDLPTEAPITLQSRVLARYLAAISNLHKGEPLHVVGHSAGGVVARSALVSNPTLKAATLITIASPNLGTGSAETGLRISNSPLGWFAPMVGAGTLNRSRALYVELVRERPGTFLGWLNRQRHPQTRYISITRANGDDWVPAYSQDLNNVAALRGKAQVVRVAGGHGLGFYDGVTIANLLAAKR